MGATNEYNLAKAEHGEGLRVRHGKVWPQILAALVVHLGAFVTGTVLCWPTVALPKLRNDETISGLTEDHLSWLAAIMPVGAVLASFPAGVALDYLGRRKTMLSVTIPIVGAWTLMYYSTDFWMLLGGRMIVSICYGAYQIGGPIFVSEIADAGIRGALVSVFNLMITVGILLVFIIGTFTSWRTLTLVSAAFPLLFHVLMLFVPESPRFLVGKGEDEAAAKSLAKLRRLPVEAVKPQIDKMKRSFEDTAEISSNLSISLEPTNMSSYLDLLRPSVLKSFGSCFGLMMLQIWSGIGPMTAFAVDVFVSTGMGIDAYHATIYVGIAQVVMCMLSMALVDKCGRKAMLIASAAVICISNASLGYFFYLKDQTLEGPPASLHWLPLPCVMGVMAGYSIGVGPVPSSILPEMLPQEARGVVSSVLRICRAIASFIVTRYFKNFMAAFGASTTFWVFASCCLAGIIFVSLLIPETKGRSLEEIQKRLHQHHDEPLPDAPLKPDRLHVHMAPGDGEEILKQESIPQMALRDLKEESVKLATLYENQEAPPGEEKLPEQDTDVLPHLTTSAV